MENYLLGFNSRERRQINDLHKQLNKNRNNHIRNLRDRETNEERNIRKLKEDKEIIKSAMEKEKLRSYPDENRISELNNQYIRVKEKIRNEETEIDRHREKERQREKDREKESQRELDNNIENMRNISNTYKSDSDEEEQRDLNALEQTSLQCLNQKKSDCLQPECRWKSNGLFKGECVPSIIHSEHQCFDRKYHDCVSPCVWGSKDIHSKGHCHYTFGSEEEFDKEYELINDEILIFNKFINILKNKNKSILYHIIKRLRYIDVKLKTIYDDIKRHQKKSLRGQSTFESIEKNTELSKKQIELKLDKEKLEQIFRKIKISSKSQSKKNRQTFRELNKIKNNKDLSNYMESKYNRRSRKVRYN